MLNTLLANKTEFKQIVASSIYKRENSCEDCLPLCGSNISCFVGVGLILAWTLFYFLRSAVRRSSVKEGIQLDLLCLFLTTVSHDFRF